MLKLLKYILAILGIWVFGGWIALDIFPPKHDDSFDKGIDAIVKAVESGNATDLIVERYQRKMAEGGL